MLDKESASANHCTAHKKLPIPEEICLLPPPSVSPDFTEKNASLTFSMWASSASFPIEPTLDRGTRYQTDCVPRLVPHGREDIAEYLPAIFPQRSSNRCSIPPRRAPCRSMWPSDGHHPKRSRYSGIQVHRCPQRPLMRLLLSFHFAKMLPNILPLSPERRVTTICRTDCGAKSC